MALRLLRTRRLQLYNAIENITLSTVSAEDGTFKFDNLTDGPYTVSVDETFEEPAVFVTLDSDNPKQQVGFKKGQVGGSGLEG